MAQKNLKQLFEIVDHAIGLDDLQRNAYLDQVCGSDRQLYEAAMRLIAAEGKLGDFLMEPAAEAERILQRLTPSDKSTRIPTTIGRYTIVRQIGRGGMGNVYLATQRLDKIEKNVALKVIRRGMDSESVVARFVMERSILASLDHPNIARVLDVGTSEDGLAYFVMEYVDGLPITEYCDAHKLSVDKRLELFITVCRASHYAHQNLVVHRDIKPSNVLVTTDGRVKLLDFGIAKLLDPTSEVYTVPVTAVGQAFLTPDYASPEQLRGDTISTATDVYSLGVLLYELLSGHRPFRSSAISRLEFLDNVTTVDPRRPSASIDTTLEIKRNNGRVDIIDPGVVSDLRRTTPRALQNLLSGELDTIVLKAIRKDPGDRYGSVAQLQEDIDRYRAGEPIMARPATIRYRLKKAFSRHRVGALSSLAGLLVVLFLTGFYIYRLAEERTAAEESARRAEGVTEFVVGLFEQGSFKDGTATDEKLRAALTLLEPALNDLDLLEGDPASRVAVLNVVGRVLTEIDTGRSIEILRDAQSLIDQGGVPVEREAETMFELGRAFFHKVEYDSAYHYSSLAVELYDKTLGPLDEKTLASRKYRAWSHNALTGSVELIDEVIQQYETHYGASSLELADLLNDVGQGHPDNEQLFEKALAIYEQTFGHNHPQTATALANLSLAIEREQPDRSLELQEDASRILENTLGIYHPITLTTLHNIAAIYVERSEFAKADSLFDVVVERHAVLNPADTTPGLAILFWRSRAKMGMGEYDVAASMHKTILDALGVDHHRYMDTLNMYVEALTMLGRKQEANAFVRAELENVDEANSELKTSMYALIQ